MFGKGLRSRAPRLGVIALGTAAACAMLGSPAGAAVYAGDGQFASWHGCDAGSQRVSSHDGYGGGQGDPADTASIYLVNDNNGSLSYKGWAEWRWNPASGCGGYQWMTVHITQAIDHSITLVTQRQGDGASTQATYAGIGAGVGRWSKMLYAGGSGSAFLLCADLGYSTVGYSMALVPHNTNGNSRFCG